jgi:hypothetical protein
LAASLWALRPSDIHLSMTKHLRVIQEAGAASAPGRISDRQAGAEPEGSFSTQAPGCAL